ncbi:hypothetical protein ACP4OV_003514 [Aristida adscensionis]
MGLMVHRLCLSQYRPQFVLILAASLSPICFSSNLRRPLSSENNTHGLLPFSPYHFFFLLRLVSIDVSDRRCELLNNRPEYRSGSEARDADETMERLLIRLRCDADNDVYKGEHNGEEIAVKKLHPLQGLDDKEFHNEFRNLVDIRHQNVVRLIGYCHASHNEYIKHEGELVFARATERVLCFEYMQGGSLDKHITDESCGLDWPTCYKIIKGTCEGLNHLHVANGGPIFHLDLKPSNILLDKNITPKIADLGLSRLVASTKTHKTEMVKGTQGYMPPEYIDGGYISNKFDVFSLGVIIIKILAGNKGYYRYSDTSPEQFIELVCENWNGRLLGTSRYSSHQIDILGVKACADIALRCVEKDRKRRPYIKDILHELEELEAKIKAMSLSSVQPKGEISQRSFDSSILAVDPTQELRFLFEPKKEASSCLQLTNTTDGFIAFSIKTNKRKYWAEPNSGVMPPCSKRYICVTLRAQEEAPPDMQCHDMFFVQAARVSDDDPTSDGTTDGFLNEGKVADMVKLPIIYVALDQFPRPNV